MLSLYLEKLRPVEENLTHYEGGTLKGYVDSIVRMLQVEENKNHKLSSFYGNWSWRGNNEYRILEDTLSDKIFAEDHLYRGQKQKNPRTSDSVTASSFKLLIRRTIQKRDEYKEKNYLHNYVKTNTMVCVLIHTMFCGCRAEKEIGDIINTDFIDHTNNCIEFQQTSDHKGRRLGSNFNFLDRLSSFIFGQEYCEPFRIFLRNRPPNAIARFFLYALPSARFEDKFWLSANKPIGPKELGKAVSREIASMVFEGLVPHGMYTNTSLKKGLADRLGYARVPPVLIDLAVGHFSSKNGQASSTFPLHRISLLIWACGSKQSPEKKLPCSYILMNLLGMRYTMKTIFLKRTQTSSLETSIIIIIMYLTNFPRTLSITTLRPTTSPCLIALILILSRSHKLRIKD